MSTKAVANHVSSKEVKSGYVMEELEQVSRHDPDHPRVGSRLGVGRPAKKMSLAENGNYRESRYFTRWIDTNL